MRGTSQQTFEQFAKVGEAGVTIMVQDAPLSGVDLPVPLLIKMAKEIETVKCFKIECARRLLNYENLLLKVGCY